MPLFRLIYASRAVDVNAAELQRILDTSVRNNRDANITGMLLFDHGAFLQLLEGPRSAVTRQFVKIAQDPRHDRVEIIQAATVDARFFWRWHMEYVASHGEQAALLARYRSGERFDPKDLSIAAMEQLCLDFANHVGQGRAAAAPVTGAA